MPDWTRPVGLLKSSTSSRRPRRGTYRLRQAVDEIVIAVFSAAWLTVAATRLCVVEVPDSDGVEGFNWEGADGP